MGVICAELESQRKMGRQTGELGVVWIKVGIIWINSIHIPIQV